MQGVRMQNLAPGIYALPYVTPKSWNKIIFQSEGKQLHLSLFRPVSLDGVQKVILWSYATTLCHSCAQAIHGNARVWMKSFFSCFSSRQYNPSSVQFPAAWIRNQQHRAPHPSQFPKEVYVHIPTVPPLASGGQLSLFLLHLIVTVWSDKCFFLWVGVMLT